MVTIYDQNPSCGINGRNMGIITMYNVSPATLAIYQQYVKEGKTPSVSIQTTNENPSSTIGRRVVVMRDCVLAKVPVTRLEDDSEELSTTDTDFTFDDLDELESYVLPENMR